MATDRTSQKILRLWMHSLKMSGNQSGDLYGHQQCMPACVSRSAMKHRSDTRIPKRQREALTRTWNVPEGQTTKVFIITDVSTTPAVISPPRRERKAK